MRQRARIALLLPSLAFSLDACAGGPGALPPVACRVGEPGASADTLSVEIHLDSLPTGGGGRVLARVDALEDGFVEFEGGGPQAAAAGLQVTPAGRLLGCAGEAPSGFRFITAARHLDKAWLRVSSERPCRYQ